jgi:ribonucleoside-diphosphate reductase alpha chain
VYIAGDAPLHLTENARHVLEARYLRRGDHREIVESPEDLFARVARGVAEAELAFGTARTRLCGRNDFTLC